MQYQFPRITLPGDIPAVVQKVREELTEYMQAVNNREGEARELEEFADVWQAFETLHRKMVAKHGPLAVMVAADLVVVKNSAPDRRYYD